MSKNRSTKRLFAVALSLVMVLALLPMTALAADFDTEITIDVSGGPYTYTGSPITPEITVTVTIGGAVINPDQYTVTYEDNINAGTATVIVAADPEGEHTGTGRKTFEIQAEAVNPTFAATTVPVGTDTAATAATLGASVLPTSGSITVGGNTVEYTIDWDGGETLDLTAAGNTATFTGTIEYVVDPGDTWFIAPDDLAVSRVVTVQAAYVPPQVIVPEKPETPDVIEGTPDDGLTEEDEDGTGLEEEEDIVDDIVDDVPETGDSAVNAVWAVLVSTLVLGAAVAFVMKKKAADNC